MIHKITISHSKVNNNEAERLSKHFEQMNFGGVNVDIRNKLKIGGGVEFEKVIYSDLSGAFIIFCLISVDYIVDCEKEIQFIEKIRNRKNIIVVPLIVGQCLNDTFLREIQSINYNDYANFEGVCLAATKILYFLLEKEKSVINFEPKELLITPHKVAAGKSVDYTEDGNNNVIYPKDYREGVVPFEVEGDSMSPLINEGERIDCKKCNYSSEIIDGNIYVIETYTQGRMLKQIELNGDKFTLKSINEKRHKSFDIEKNEIKAFWKIVRKFSVSEI